MKKLLLSVCAFSLTYGGYYYYTSFGNKYIPLLKNVLKD